MYVIDMKQFWTTFFEQAAQIRVPTYEEYSAENDTQTEQEQESQAADEQSRTENMQQDTTVPSESFTLDRTSSEHSFMPGQAAVMSTPATTRHQSHRDAFLGQDEQTPSWSASLESPLARLDRDLQSLTREDEVSVASSSILHHSKYDESQEITERQIHPPTFERPSQRSILIAQNDKGKGKETAESLRRDILRRGIDASGTTRSPMVSPLKVKGKTPILKSMNPYLSPGVRPSEWRGVVDLKDPTVATPRGKTPRAKARFAAPSTTKRSATPGPNRDIDLDEDLDATLGMSPPVMMAFAKLPKAATPKLGRTPRKKAAERITKNLLDVEKRLGDRSGAEEKPQSVRGGYNIFSKPGGVGTTESSLTSVPTPPSLSRYNRTPYHAASEVSSSLTNASLESMMRRVGLNVPGFDYRPGKPTKEDVSSISSSIPSVPSGNAYARPSLSQAVYSSASAAPQEQVRKTPSPPMFDMRHLVDDELVDPNANDDSLDSLDYEDDQDASAAFLAAQQGMQFDDDNSFSSGGSSDSMDDEGGVHPFGHAMSVEDDGDAFDDEDSYDDPRYNAESTEEETLFGVPPAQRLAHQAAQSRMSEGNLRMLGQELLEDTIGIGAQMARTGAAEETPTPWMK